MNNRLEANLLGGYADSSFLIQQKARVLMYFMIVAFLLVLVITINNNLLLDETLSSSRNIMRFFILALVVACILLLKGGRYTLTANIAVFGSTAAMALQVLLGDFSTPFDLSVRLSYLFIFIIMASVFGTRLSTLVCAAGIFITAAGVIARTPVLEGAEKTSISVSFFAILVFITLLSYLFQSIVQSALQKLEEEAKKDEERTLLKKVLATVQDVSTELGGLSENLTDENLKLRERTTGMASVVEEVRSAIEESASAVGRSTESTAQASRLALGTVRNAREGVSLVNETITSMSKIKGSSKKITEITELLAEISFQTNILSLNAAIEAARAGQHGRGFAVVAGEVRNLAQRSAGAAKEIEDHIRDTLDTIREGSALVDRCGVSIKEIATAIQAVSGMMEELAGDGENQRHSITQINNSMIEVEKAIQENARLAENTAGATDDIARQAGALIALFDKQSRKNGKGDEEMKDKGD